MKQPTYQHYKKKENNYVVVNSGEMQINNVWYECVIYQCLESKKVYVRESSDFEFKFSIVKKSEKNGR